MPTMGVLLGAVAVRSDDADEVVDVFLSVLRGVGHLTQPIAGPPDHGGSCDVLCAASGGWVTPSVVTLSVRSSKARTNRR